MTRTSFLKDKTKYIAFAGFCAVFLLISALMQVSLMFASVMLLWTGLLIYALSDLKGRAAYALFLVAFFLFLLGGEFLELYMGYPPEFTFTDEIDFHAYVSLFVSLLFLHLSFYLTERLTDRHAIKKKTEPQYKTRFTEDIRQVAKWGVYIATIPYFLTTLEACLYSLKHGYLSYYTDFHSSLPGVIGTISELFPLFFCFFLATLPPKKECKIPMLIYLCHGVTAILTGRRIMFGVALLVLLFYILIRHLINPKEQWLNKKKLLIGLILCPLIVVLLYVQRYLRYDQAVEGGANLLDIIFRFLSQQGSSIGVLKHQKVLEGDSLGCTSLYYTLHYLRGNFLTRGLFDFPLEYYLQRTVETAYHTNCLADYIMYKVSPSDFFAGYGLGTSYIAELYHDLGHVGIALGSAIYGFLLQWLYSLKRFSFFKFTCGLIILEQFVILPRYGADVLMRPFYSLTNLFVLTLLIGYALMGKQRTKKILSKFKIKGNRSMFKKLKGFISTRNVMLNTPPMGEFRHITDEEVKQLQGVMLQMVKDVHEVCEKHGICYMADGGTALGSVRHKGFIPWDDDVDLIMPRDDLNRFVEIFDEELGDKYELVTPNSEGHKVASLITEIYAKGTYKPSIHNLDMDLPQGVMIDIFPLEYAPLNPIVRKIKGTVAMILQYIAISATFYNLYCTPKKKAFFYQTKAGKFNFNFRRFIGFFFSFRSYQKWCNTFDKFVRGKYDTGLWCIPTDVGHYFGHLMPKKVFYPPIKGQFEDMEVYLPNDIHEYLVNAYGDYMWIPPVEQREKHWTAGFCLDTTKGEPEAKV